MRNLDITTLRSFLTVAEQGGVTRAAAALNLTQSAVSMQIKRLEDILGLALLDRANRRVTLTASGEQLLNYARQIVRLNDEAVGRLTDKIFEGEIVLGAPHDIVYPVIPRVLKTFNAAFPRVRVQLQSSSTMRLHEALARNELDLILTTEQDVKPGGETLTEMPMRWTGAVGGQAWRKRPLRLAFCRVCTFRPIVLQKVQEAGIAWELAVDSEDDRAVEALVSADLAVGAMLEESLPPHLEAIAPGCELPELGFQKINMYGSARARGEVPDALAEMLRSGYAGARRPILSSVAG